MENSSRYYQPVWDFAANIFNSSNDFFSSTAIVPREHFEHELQLLKARLSGDLGGPASLRFQRISELLDDIEKSNAPHPLFRKTVWINNEDFLNSLEQIHALVPQSLWIEIEAPPAIPDEPVPVPELGSPLGIALESILWLAMLAFLYVNITSGTTEQREACIILVIMGIAARLTYLGVIKQTWVEGAAWAIFLVMCIGGPLLALHFCGDFFGWW